MNKVFIIGLPRSGTTSISMAMLDYDLKVAHTAYTKHAFEIADVVSDAPCFSDYQELDAIFPNSKFIYLDRALELWLPSIQMLLQKMQHSLEPNTGVFSPVLKRSMNETFDLYLPTHEFFYTKKKQRKFILNPRAFDSDHLAQCYQRHQAAVKQYFSKRDDFLAINISHADSLSQLVNFLALPLQNNKQFPHTNKGRRVADWGEHKHPNKVNPNSAGLEGRKFFNYKT